jgi:hypothetical protein
MRPPFIRFNRGLIFKNFIFYLLSKRISSILKTISRAIKFMKTLYFFKKKSIQMSDKIKQFYSNFILFSKTLQTLNKSSNTRFFGRRRVWCLRACGRIWVLCFWFVRWTFINIWSDGRPTLTILSRFWYNTWSDSRRGRSHWYFTLKISRLSAFETLYGSNLSF